MPRLALTVLLKTRSPSSPLKTEKTSVVAPPISTARICISQRSAAPSTISPTAPGVGIIGTGKIGSVMCKIMHGFGCKLLGYDTEESQNLKQLYHINYTSLEELCAKSDIISLHVPLNAETHQLINEDLISEMKDGVIIINTARGSVINTEHIISGLRSGKIGALGIDVYENEKGIFFKDQSKNIPDDDNLIRLNALPNVLMTGHHAFLTEEALTNIAETTIHNLDCWSRGYETENELTNLIATE